MTSTEKCNMKWHKILSIFLKERNLKVENYNYLDLLPGGNVNAQQEGSLMTLLHYACQIGEKEIVEKLLNDGADIFIKDSSGNLPIHYLAACSDSVDTLELIWQHASNSADKQKLLEAENIQGVIPLRLTKNFQLSRLFQACYKDINLFCPHRIEDHPIPIFLSSGGKENDILKAVETDDVVGVENLLKTPQISIATTRNKDGYDAIRVAASHDNVKNVEMLLPHCYLKMFRNENLLTVAIKHDSIKVIEYLFFHTKAKVTQINVGDLKKCEYKTVTEVCKNVLLFERNFENFDTVLHLGAKNGNVAIMKILLQFYRDVNVRNIHLHVPLHIAATNKNEEAFELLLARSRYSLDLHDENGETPFSIAYRHMLPGAIKHFDGRTIGIYESHNRERRKFYLNLAIKTNNILLLRNILKEDLNYLSFSSTKGIKASIMQNVMKRKPINENDIIQDSQECLKIAIKEGFSNSVAEFLRYEQWSKIFQRLPPQECYLGDKSPMQLLVEYLPEMAKKIFEHCIFEKNGKVFYNYELINDSLNSAINNNNQEASDSNTLSSVTVLGKQIPVGATFSRAQTNESNSEQIKLLNSKSEKHITKEELHKIISSYPVSLMIKHSRYELLAHPFVISYVTLKWNKFAKWGYYGLCLFYLIVAVLLSSLIIFIQGYSSVEDIKPEMEEVNISSDFNGEVNISLSLILKSPLNTFSEDVKIVRDGKEAVNILVPKLISCIVVTIVGLLHCFLIYSKRNKFYRNLDLKHNWLDFFFIVLTLFAGLPGFFCTSFSAQRDLIIILNFCAWLNLLNFIKKHPRFGLYVIMVSKVITSFLRFSPIFIMLLLPFVVLFYVLLGEEQGIFAFFDTFIRTLVMMIGEFDYKESVAAKNSFVTSAIFGLFLFASTIFLMNILIGLAVSDVTKIMKDAVERRRIMQIETIHQMELTMPESWRKKYWGDYCQKSMDALTIEKETHQITSFYFRDMFKWFGLPKNATKDLLFSEDSEPNENKLHAIKNEINQKMEELYNAKFLALDKNFEQKLNTAKTEIDHKLDRIISLIANTNVDQNVDKR